ncbi:MAG TPA: hypothetical protein P5121_19050 [Caldilineaceae bacterium]|nr:hypothetical protein [Caldilineaceae bacterium]
MAFQEKERERPVPVDPVTPEPLSNADPTTTTATGQESVYVAKDVEPTESPVVAREGEVLRQRQGMSPLVGIGGLIVLIIVIYLLYLLFT